MTSRGLEKKREGRGTGGGRQLHAWVSARLASTCGGVRTAEGWDFALETLATDKKVKFSFHTVGFPEFAKAVT